MAIRVKYYKTLAALLLAIVVGAEAAAHAGSCGSSLLQCERAGYVPQNPPQRPGWYWAHSVNKDDLHVRLVPDGEATP